MNAWLMWGGVSLAAGLLVPFTASQGPPATEEAAHKAQVYDNPQAFAQMSGAKRTALEHKFGRRPVRGVAITGEAFTDEVARSAAGPLAPFGNILVNSPAAD